MLVDDYDKLLQIRESCQEGESVNPCYTACCHNGRTNTESVGSQEIIVSMDVEKEVDIVERRHCTQRGRH